MANAVLPIFGSNLGEHMSYLKIPSIIKRLQAGVVTLSDGEMKALINYLLERQDELIRQVESLRRSESTGSTEEEDTGDGVRRGRKPKQNKGNPSSTTGDVRSSSHS
tara:strand:- start:2547 stop:2867 length:321 start_codon:yes stop_codon:yes gene_type:complete